MAPLVAALFVGLFPPLGAAAQTDPDDIALITESVVIATTGFQGIKVCAGEEEKIFASINDVVTYTTVSGQSRIARHQPRYGEVVEATVADPSIVTVSPPIGVTGPPLGDAIFVFTGTNPGRTTIEFTDPIHGIVAPASVAVEVVECYWKVTIVSIWHLEDGGFNPTMTATITDAELRRDSAAQSEFLGTSLVRNRAAGRPSQGCVPVISVNDDNVELHGSLVGNRRRTLEVIIVFHPVAAVTTARCPGVAPSAEDTGRPDPLDFRVPAVGGGTRVTHILDAGRSVSGVARIKVVKVIP